MPPEPFEAWISIYNDEIEATWESERAELRKVSMIYCAFQHELDKLKAGLNDEIEELRSELKRRDYLQKSKSFVGLAKSQHFDIDIDTDKENEVPESVPLQEIHKNDIQSEDIIIESPNTSTFFDNCKSPPLITSACGKSCSNGNKKKSTVSFLYPRISHKIDKTSKSAEVRKDFKTPLDPDDTNIMECSIIEDTPDLKNSLRNKTRNSRLSLLRRNKSKLSQSKQKSTITQKFTLQSPKKKKKKRQIDSNGPSMSINAMLDLINESSSSATEEDLDKSTDDLEVSSFVKNYDKVPEKKSGSPDYVYNEVVRGKERKKLKGWACAECENYYKGLDLPPEEIEKKKDHCSRHRYKFKAPQETFAGFWDLTFQPTPKTPEEKSLVFNYKKS